VPSARICSTPPFELRSSYFLIRTKLLNRNYERDFVIVCEHIRKVHFSLIHSGFTRDVFKRVNFVFHKTFECVLIQKRFLIIFENIDCCYTRSQYFRVWRWWDNTFRICWSRRYSRGAAEQNPTGKPVESSRAEETRTLSRRRHDSVSRAMWVPVSSHWVMWLVTIQHLSHNHHVAVEVGISTSRDTVSGAASRSGVTVEPPLLWYQLGI